MEKMVRLFDDLGSYMESGGFVMWPLMLGTVFLWFGLGYRMLILKRGSRLPLRVMIDSLREDAGKGVKGFVDASVVIAWNIRRESAGAKGIYYYLEDALFPLNESMSRYRSLVRVIVILAPLLGLLGTVNGMIEMFDSLADQTFYSQSGGIANGISQALFTTQFGLVVAVPGMIAGRLLDKREDKMKDELIQIKEYFTAMGETTE